MVGGTENPRKERGAALLFAATTLVVLLGVSALAIDLVSFYVARNEAQRSADAAALAGAYSFLMSACSGAGGGCAPGGPQETPATRQALDTAAQNPVWGQAPADGTVQIAFSYPTPQEPQITVSVFRDGAHGNALSTSFAKALGVSSVNVSATATAEIYNPTGSAYTPPVTTSYMKPFLVPNCDPGHPLPGGTPPPAGANSLCIGINPATGSPTAGPYFDCAGSGGAGNCYASYFFDPNTGAVLHPQTYIPGSTSGGIQGEPWTLHTESGPSQWYVIAFTGQSGADLRTYIGSAASTGIACGAQMNTYNGASSGPVAQGVDDLINATGACLRGQDTICGPDSNSNLATGTTCSTFQITGGTNNPIAVVRGRVYAGPSPSVVTVAVYDGNPILPAGGGPVPILGFMQLFITESIGTGGNTCTGNGKDVRVVIMNVSSCAGGGNGGSSDGSVSGAGTAIPIRLIRQ